MALSALPAASFAAVVIVAVYCVFAARLAEGVNCAVFPVMVTLPPTTVPPDVLTTVKLVDVSEVVVIASENVAEIAEFNATPEAAFAGETDETVGGVVSDPLVVVKFQLKLERR